MSAQLRSTNISLLFDYWPEPGEPEYRSLSELWQSFRRTAVEPAQAPSLDFASFADDCLLCAHISINPPGVPTKELDAASVQPSPLLPTRDDQRAGLIYLHAGPANYPAGEANIGVIVKHNMRHRGYAHEAVQLVLGWAFEELKFHRVQAAILDTPFRDSALRLFIGSGFVHEGTKRRAVYQPEGEGIASTWKDVTYLAMLDTEWMLQSTWRRAQERPVISVWDEMFARHAREQEELVRWEEKHKRMRRSSSRETLRENTQNAVLDLAYLTDDTTSFGAPSRESSPSRSPRPNVVVICDQDSEMEDNLGVDELRLRWGNNTSLRPSPCDPLLSLPSIASTGLSEGNPQSPVTIPSASTPGSTPPSSPSPSPAPSTHSSWIEFEEEENWHRPYNLLVQSATPRDSYPHTMQSRFRSNSTSSSDSGDSWSDAQSSFGACSSTWDVISDTSDHSLRAHV